MAKDTQRAVSECLAHPQGTDWLKELFWEVLNYDRIDRPFPRHDWPERARVAIADDPLLLAEENDFQIIYSRLAADRLRLTDERAIINRLRREHPYGLFVFSDVAQLRWHLVKVKLAGEASSDGNGRKKRYLLRRIAVGPEERLRTASERIAMLDVGPDTDWIQRLGHPPSALEVQARHDEAFDVEAVTQAFFQDYKKAFHHLQEHLRDQTDDAVWAHNYALQFLNRLMFLYFIQRKGWLGEDPEFIKSFWQAYHSSGRPKDSFFKEWLSVLFFEAFNRKFQAGRHDRQHFPNEIRKALAKAPFLNGGLFRRNELDEKYRFKVSDRIFTELIHDPQRNEPGFFEHYNFTITETTPLDQEVAVDPEMIGRVYESLVNITFEDLKEEDLRGMAGIFYTPRIEIDLMSRLALVDCLTNYLGEGYKSLLYEAVFAYEPDEKQVADDQLARENLWPKLGELLREITVLDPACGSGSFLVGMLLLLDDLLARADKQLGIEETPYERRKRIIGRSLYGVDVMEWAVHVAELRLWLQLVVETELQLEERTFRPLLPNLSFKVRPGDSLVQEVGGISFALHRDKKKLEIPPVLKGKLTRLKGEKRKFYNNDPSCIYRSEAEIKQAERLLFQEILQSKIASLQDEIATLERKIASPEKQLTLSGIARVEPRQLELQVESWKRQRKESEEESVRLQDALHALSSSEKVPFVWDIAFVEIFEGEKQGFDIVIGNPPYVRQEKIAPPTKRPEEHGGEGSEEWRKLKAEYKAKLQHSVAAAYQRFFDYRPQEEKQGRKLDGKSDYYVYFYLHGLSLLNERGSFCFITSNSWLDVGYGKDLQEFLLKHSQVKMILDNEAKRSFAQSDVNTIIALLAPVDDRKDRGLDKTARFVMFKVPFEEILHPVIFEEIEEVQSGSRKPTPDYRAIAISQRKLYEEGLALPEDEGKKTKKMVKAAHYVGNKWGVKYLKMPEFLYPHIEKQALVPLGDICKLGRGKTTGIVDFFIFDREIANRWGIENEFLKPIITSTHEIEKYAITPQNVRKYIFVCPYSLKKLGKKGYTGAIKYVEWGSKQVTRKKAGHTIANVPWPNIPSVKGNHPEWHCLQLKEPGDFLVPRLIRERFFFASNPDELLDTDMFFHGRFLDREVAKLGGALLNNTLVYLMLELFGRHNIPGRFNIYGPELKPLYIPNPDLFDDKVRERLQDDFQELSSRNVKNIFEEFGLHKSNRNPSNIDPNDVSLDKVLPDRRALDEVVFETLGLTEEEQLAVYRAVVELVKNRLVKARSV